MLKILFVCPQIGKSGNFTTVSRISSHLKSFGHHVEVCGLDDDAIFQSSRLTSYSVIFTIHAYKSAKLLRVVSEKTQVILLFGGTDLNENLKSAEQRDVMRQVVERCFCCVTFSDTMRTSACSAWPEFADKITVIHQGIITGPSKTFNLRHYLLYKHLYTAKDKIVLLVAGVRPVKDPLFLLEAFAESKLSETTSFVIIGSVIDEKYGNMFVSEVYKLRDSNVLYAGELSLSDTHAAIQQSYCLVNSSLSEGMCGAILEAFDLRVPVLARNIPGNQYLVEDGLTGILYHTPQEFIDCLRKLMASADLTEQLARSAKIKLDTWFSIEKERELYEELLNRL